MAAELPLIAAELLLMASVFCLTFVATEQPPTVRVANTTQRPCRVDIETPIALRITPRPPRHEPVFSCIDPEWFLEPT
jgi:hypothetical protein